MWFLQNFQSRAIQSDKKSQYNKISKDFLSVEMDTEWKEKKVCNSSWIRIIFCCAFSISFYNLYNQRKWNVIKFLVRRSFRSTTKWMNEPLVKENGISFEKKEGQNETKKQLIRKTTEWNGIRLWLWIINKNTPKYR